MKKKKDRKVNLIKALKRENAHLKWENELLGRETVDPLRIYETNLKHQRIGYAIGDCEKSILDDEIAPTIAKNRIGYQFRAFLDECILKEEDDGIVTKYYFDFWVE